MHNRRSEATPHRVHQSCTRVAYESLSPVNILHHPRHRASPSVDKIPKQHTLKIDTPIALCRTPHERGKSSVNRRVHKALACALRWKSAARIREDKKSHKRTAGGFYTIHGQRQRIASGDEFVVATPRAVRERALPPSPPTMSSMQSGESIYKLIPQRVALEEKPLMYRSKVRGMLGNVRARRSCVRADRCTRSFRVTLRVSIRRNGFSQSRAMFHAVFRQHLPRRF